jgi:hypothetical protein
MVNFDFFKSKVHTPTPHHKLSSTLVNILNIKTCTILTFILKYENAQKKHFNKYNNH